MKLTFSISLFYPEVKNREKMITDIVTALFEDGFTLHRFVMYSVLLKKGRIILEIKRGEHPEVVRVTMTGWEEDFEEFYSTCRRLHDIIVGVLKE